MPATADVPSTTTVPGASPTVAETTDPAAELVESDTLVEDVSIDGMCGVY